VFYFSEESCESAYVIGNAGRGFCGSCGSFVGLDTSKNSTFAEFAGPSAPGNERAAGRFWRATTQFIIPSGASLLLCRPLVALQFFFEEYFAGGVMLEMGSDPPSQVRGWGTRSLLYFGSLHYFGSLLCFGQD
jgi:hypothetical protein